MKKIIKSAKGVALAAVIIIFAVVAIIGTTVATISVSQAHQSVASEDTTAAYYYARSAVDVVKTQIKAKQDTYNTALAAYLVNPFDPARITAYTNALAAYHKYVPASPGEKTLTLSGILPDSGADVEVTVSKTSSGMVEVRSTVEYDKGASSARFKIGTFTEQQIQQSKDEDQVYTSGMLGKDTLFSWGNINIENNFTMEDDGAITGTITAQGDVTIHQAYSGTVTENSDKRNAPIIAPPISTSGPPLNYTALVGNHVPTIDKDDNGFYGNYNSQTNDHTSWTIDTSKGDVILVFSSFYAEAISINVTGNHNFYIYVKEPYDGANIVQRNLFILKNSTMITTNNSDTTTANPPRTYVIINNDAMQHYSAQTTPPTTVMPGAYAQSLTKLDNVSVANNSSSGLSAYFYAPGCTFTSENNSNLFSSVYANYINIANHSVIHPYPMDYDTLKEPTKGTSYVTKVSKPYSYTGITSAFVEKWIR